MYTQNTHSSYVHNLYKRVHLKQQPYLLYLNLLFEDAASCWGRRRLRTDLWSQSRPVVLIRSSFNVGLFSNHFNAQNLEDRLEAQREFTMWLRNKKGWKSWKRENEAGTKETDRRRREGKMTGQITLHADGENYYWSGWAYVSSPFLSCSPPLSFIRLFSPCNLFPLQPIYILLKLSGDSLTCNLPQSSLSNILEFWWINLLSVS